MKRGSATADTAYLLYNQYCSELIILRGYSHRAQTIRRFVLQKSDPLDLVDGLSNANLISIEHVCLNLIHSKLIEM